MAEIQEILVRFYEVHYFLMQNNDTNVKRNIEQKRYKTLHYFKHPVKLPVM